MNSSSTTINDEDSPNIICKYCDVPLIKKMDDIHLFGKEAGGATRFICPRCGTIKDPLKLEDNINRMKRGEKGQTIRSNNSNSITGC